MTERVGPILQKHNASKLSGDSLKPAYDCKNSNANQASDGLYTPPFVKPLFEEDYYSIFFV